MWLAGAAVIAGIKECEEAVGGVHACVAVPCLETCVCGFEIVLFEDVRLRSPFFSCENEVVWDDGEFVQDKSVGRVLGREVGDQ